MSQTLTKQIQNIEVTNDFLKDYQLRLDQLLQQNPPSKIDQLRELSYQGLGYLSPIPQKLTYVIKALPRLYKSEQKEQEKKEEGMKEEEMKEEGKEEQGIVGNVKEGIKGGVEKIGVGAKYVKTGAGNLYSSLSTKVTQSWSTGWQWFKTSKQIRQSTNIQKL